MITRVLKSVFSMCKTIATETNENRRDIIEIKSHLGLPIDPYRELPSLMLHLRSGTLKMREKDKRKKRRRTMKMKKRRTTMTSSDPAAPHFLFGA
jgi:hypothetical protein